jgi:hypothetical protein
MLDDILKGQPYHILEYQTDDYGDEWIEHRVRDVLKWEEGWKPRKYYGEISDRDLESAVESWVERMYHNWEFFDGEEEVRVRIKGESSHKTVIVSAEPTIEFSANVRIEPTP